VKMKLENWVLSALVPIAFAFVFLIGSAQAATLRLGVNADALSMDPIASSDNPSIWTQLLLFDQLVRPSKDGTKLEPGIAESWQVSPDGKEYEFKLRANAKFSNGDPVTAQDVEFSLRRAAGEKSQWGRFFRPITEYKVVDDRTIVMRLETPFTPMLNNLAMFSASVLPAKLVQSQDAAFFDKPVGSGPFILTQWNRGQKQVMVKNPYYWEAGKPTIDGVVIEILPEDNSRVLKLKAGELDAIIGVPFNQVDGLKSDPNVAIGVVQDFRTDMVQINTTKKPFDDVRVRQALNYAVDKAPIVQGVLRGHGTVANSPLPLMAHHNTDVKPYPFDPAKAKALLTAAGYPNGFKTSMLVAGGDATARQVASVLQSSLKKVGVDVELQSIESSSQFSTTKAGNFELSLGRASSDTIDPDQLIGFLVVNPERANAYHTQWKDERINDLYALERKTPEGEERGKMFKEIEARAHEGAPFIFLYRQTSTFAHRKNVTGFTLMRTSNYDLRNVVIQ
jgi:peptide/nickel transport system substrate-binding protein